MYAPLIRPPSRRVAYSDWIHLYKASIVDICRELETALASYPDLTWTEEDIVAALPAFVFRYSANAYRGDFTWTSPSAEKD